MKALSVLKIIMTVNQLDWVEKKTLEVTKWCHKWEMSKEVEEAQK